jgi:hypothetical protein
MENVNMKNGVMDAAMPLPIATPQIECHSTAVSRLTCSIIIPVRRGGTEFKACLESVAAAIEPGVEIIVVADGEGDASWHDS